MAVDTVARALALGAGAGGGGEGGTTNYNALENKPSINGVTLSGNKSLNDIGVTAAITEKVAEIVAGAPEDFDTLKEISAWIENHEESAAAMNLKIQENTNKIAELYTISMDVSGEVLTFTKN